MTRERTLLLVLLLASVSVLYTCGGDPQEPEESTPGWVNVTVISPNTDDGGIVFTITGTTVDSVRSSAANSFIRRESAGVVRVVVVANFGSGTALAQVFVPDVDDPGDVSATVTEVAARGPTFFQRAVGGYTLTVGTGSP